MLDSAMGVPEFRVFHVGAAPVIRQLIDEMDLIRRIDQRCPVKKEACNLSVGTRVAAMIINQLTDRKAQYKVQEFYQEQDVELLLGPGVQASDLNDDALARALDALYQTGLPHIYWEAVQGVQQAAGHLTWDRLHFDTTSLLYYGSAKEEEDVLKITRGYSKDHRPDLPQIKIGMGTTPEGIPVYGQVLDGNQDDKTWNLKVIQALENLFSPEQLADVIYVADSAFVTENNLKGTKRGRNQPDLRFLSRLPENFKLAKQLKEKAWNSGEWQDVGAFSDAKDAATYRICPLKAKLYGETYRFLVVYSSKLDGRKKKSLESKIDKERENWEKDQEKLEKQTFACQTDAETALAAFLKAHRGSHTMAGTIVSEERPGKRKKRGRPKRGEAPPPTETVYRIQLNLSPPSEETMDRLRQQASTFILITNERDPNNLTDVNLLKGYKEQQTVENRFRFLKSPYFVGRVYLAKPERVEAFAYVMMLSVMVYSLMEYLLRQKLAEEKDPLDLLGRRKSFRPTGESVLEILDTVQIVHMAPNGKTMRLFPENVRPQVERILALLGMDLTIYTEPRGENAVEKSIG